MNLNVVLLMMLLPLSATAVPFPTITPGALPVTGTAKTAQNTSADEVARRAAINAAAANSAAINKVGDCAAKMKKAADDALAQRQANIVYSMDDAKKKSSSFLSCLSKYSKIGVNTSLHIPDANTIMDQIEKMACSAVDAAVAKATDPFNKGVQYNDGIINASGTINPVVFGGQGWKNTTTYIYTSVPNILN